MNEKNNTDNGNAEPLLTFPTKFPIKIFGLDNSDFVDAIKQIIHTHVVDTDLLNWQQNQSSKKNYLAITVTITARSQAQLDAIYMDLSAHQLVKMAL